MSPDGSVLRTATDGYLSIAALRKRYGAAAVLDGVDLRVAKGEIVSLLGPSGCGKTTLLRAIAGLVETDAGRIEVDGIDVTALPPHKREIGVVFQNYALFPHLSVAGNVGIGLKAKGVNSEGIAVRVREMLALVRMTDYADRPVRQLSGGQQQRVAVARALAVSPRLLLLDEPFSALDRKLREAMQVDLRALLVERAITAIFVTHDQDEAMAVSDRVAVMRKGTIEQFAAPRILYASPATRFVHDFVGLSSVLTGEIASCEGGICKVATALGTTSAPGHFVRGAKVALCVRPERIELAEEGEGLAAPIRHVVFSGSRALVHAETQGGDRLIAEIDAAAADRCGPGLSMRFRWASNAARLFPLADETA